VTLEDIAAFGQLYLNKGMWDGKQLISEEWVTEATSKHIPNGADKNSDWEQGYGYQFWRCRNGAYRGDGAYGQYCLVMPEQDMVIAITAGISDMQAPLNLIFDTFLDGLSQDALAPSDKANELEKVLSSLKLNINESQKSLAFTLDGNFHLSESFYGYEDIFITLSESGLLLILKDDESECSIKTKEGEWTNTKLNFLGGVTPASTSGYWTSSGTYKLEVRLTETAVVDYYEFKNENVFSIEYLKYENHWERCKGVVTLS
jgi:hypothetical protein